MMNDFQNREKGHETHFVLGEELRFKATARRNKLLGLWAADLLGLTGDEAGDYATKIIRTAFENPGDEGIFRTIRTDFDAKNIPQSDHQIKRTMEELMAKAYQQVERKT